MWYFIKCFLEIQVDCIHPFSYSPRQWEELETICYSKELLISNYLGTSIGEEGGTETENMKRVRACWRNWKEYSGDPMMPAKLSGNVYKAGIIQIMIASSSLGSRSVLAAVGRSPQHAVSKLACICCHLPDRVAPVLVQFVSPPLGWSPLSSFLFIWCLQVVTCEVHRLYFRRLIYL